VTEAAYVHHEACQKALKSLELQETGYRIEQVDRAEKHTVEWLFKETKLGFESWLKAGCGIYWIRGKPASGKSTLMKMAFFFHDRGSEIQKSFDGLLHSILYQLLSDLPPPLLIHHVPIYQQIAKDKRPWPINELKRAFTEVFSQTSIKADICLFLDALDEYSGSHGSMANFLNQIVTTGNEAYTRIKICFSSRPLQIFLDRFPDAIGFDLHEWTVGDIELVIKSRMSDNTRMHQYMHSSAAKDRELALQFANRICFRGTECLSVGRACP
jgi:hypothetical protein